MRYFEICFNFLNVITVLFLLANFVTTYRFFYVPHFLFILPAYFFSEKKCFWIHFGNLKLDSKRFSKSFEAHWNFPWKSYLFIYSLL